MTDPRATSLPFREAAEFWRRKVNVPTAGWRDLQRGDHAHGFMVAGAARMDVLNGLRDAVDKVQDGASIEQFRKDFDDVVARTGWQYKGGRNWRTHIIYQTNLRSAYQAGRWQQMQAIKHRRPYWQYVHNDSVRHPRPEHLSWNGKVLNADDPWWSTHYPPNGYGCQCTVRTLAPRDLARRGLEVEEAPTPVADTAGLDPGFDYNVGEAASSLPAAVRFGQKVMALPPDWRAIALADAQKRPTDLFVDWAGTAARVVGELDDAEAGAAAVRPLGSAYPVGFLRPKVAAALAAGENAAGQAFAAPAVSTALLSVEDARLYHAVRSAKGDSAALLRTTLAQWPRWLADLDTVVLWDTQAGNLVYAHRLNDGRYIKLAFAAEVGAERHREVRRAKLATQWLRTAGVVEGHNLREPHYVVLDGELE